MNTRFLSLAAAVALAGATFGSASAATHLTGTIHDNSGRVVSGMTVRLLGSDQAPQQTDAHGSFSFMGLDPGVVQLIVEPAEFDGAGLIPGMVCILRLPTDSASLHLVVNEYYATDDSSKNAAGTPAISRYQNERCPAQFAVDMQTTSAALQLANQR